MSQPPTNYLRQCFDETNGRLFWRYRPLYHFKSVRAWRTWNSRFAGKEAGYPNQRRGGARWIICLDYSMLLRYQIVWAINKGFWVESLDHKNRNPSDDRIENLRPTTQSQNAANAKRFSSNSSGFKGVQWREKTQKWQASIRVNYRVLHLGSFDDPSVAHAAYVRAAKKYFGKFACAG